jgi:hypothetical protein
MVKNITNIVNNYNINYDTFEYHITIKYENNNLTLVRENKNTNSIDKKVLSNSSGPNESIINSVYLISSVEDYLNLINKINLEQPDRTIRNKTLNYFIYINNSLDFLNIDSDNYVINNEDNLFLTYILDNNCVIKNIHDRPLVIVNKGNMININIENSTEPLCYINKGIIYNCNLNNFEITNTNSYFINPTILETIEQDNIDKSELGPGIICYYNIGIVSNCIINNSNVFILEYNNLNLNSNNYLGMICANMKKSYNNHYNIYGEYSYSTDTVIIQNIIINNSIFKFNRNSTDSKFLKTNITFTIAGSKDKDFFSNIILGNNNIIEINNKVLQSLETYQVGDNDRYYIDSIISNIKLGNGNIINIKNEGSMKLGKLYIRYINIQSIGKNNIIINPETNNENIIMKTENMFSFPLNDLDIITEDYTIDELNTNKKYILFNFNLNSSSILTGLNIEKVTLKKESNNGIIWNYDKFYIKNKDGNYIRNIKYDNINFNDEFVSNDITKSHSLPKSEYDMYNSIVKLGEIVKKINNNEKLTDTILQVDNLKKKINLPNSMCDSKEKKCVYNSLFYSFPIGTVIPFYSDKIPYGWRICNGYYYLKNKFINNIYIDMGRDYDYNNNVNEQFSKNEPSDLSKYIRSPNLINRFIRGKDNSNNIYDTGGTTMLVNNQIPQHQHDMFTNDMYTYKVTKGGNLKKSYKSQSTSEFDNIFGTSFTNNFEKKIDPDPDSQLKQINYKYLKFTEPQNINPTVEQKEFIPKNINIIYIVKI